MAAKPSFQVHQAKRAAKAASTEARRAPDKAGELEHKPAFRKFARVGIGARGVIYLLLAYIAAVIAVKGRAPAPASGQGALAEVGRQPGGRPLLVVLAIGLAAYALFRALQALGRGPALGHEGEPKAYQRVGWGALAVAYAYLCARAVELALSSNSGGSGGASSHPQPLVAHILRWPGGPVWLGAIGVVVGGSGVALAIWGVVHDYSENLDRHRLGGAKFQTTRAVGMAGEVTRGFLVVLVSVYLVEAAVKDNPGQAKSLGQALSTFARSAAGTAVLWLVAAGLVCFGAYSLAEAFFRKL